MKSGSPQFDMRENPASDRRHGSPSGANVQSTPPIVGKAPPVSLPMYFITENAPPSIGDAVDATQPAATVEGRETPLRHKQSAHAETGVERPMTCDEAAQFLRVHPKTVKRMARSGELPGHFRFGRWFFYASELDAWMKVELNSPCHSCR